MGAIARAVGVSLSWLQRYTNKKYEQIPREVQVRKKSNVQKKKNKQWIWLALDRETREIVGAYVGKRDAQAAQKLWDSLPPVYRQCAVSYTDYWETYQVVLPNKRHLQ